ncbi:hypothetical protein [Fodinicola feengrottensis]|uniref:DUF4386 family protein n=1 Tax=Fodinicola feengrottensis TaxID=435914 RepID=A0ABN2HMV6_9ACTN|nr:hypothetical protein [Fodinicola feengrottensis]
MTSLTGRLDASTSSLSTVLPFVGAPACFLAGWVLLRPIGGQAEPGGWWTASHAMWLVGFLLFLVMALQFRWAAAARTTGQRIAVTACVVVVGLSAIANAVQVTLDLVGGFQAGNRADLQHAFAAFQRIPGVSAVFYGVGAQVIFLGLLVFAVMVSTIRRAGWWSTALVVVGTLVMSVGTLGFGRNNWLVPVGMVGLLLGFAGLTRLFHSPAE